ncbi:hypothetical protein MKX79_14825 [Viridibacillus sp. FSL R5-0468]|uniref:hypothetical protein n=1 Tax=Viridibacillus sp. FSL R5-0468 TaxID=2921640 RepID=UPI0030FB0C02
MINILGIILSFIGTFLTLSTLVFSKANKKGTTWDELQKISLNQYKSKWISIFGLVLITIGFIMQLYVAVKTM